MTRAIRDERAQQLQMSRAGFASRAFAGGLDIASIVVLYAAALFAYGLVRYLVTSAPLELPTPQAWVRIVVAAVVAVAYLSWSWAGTGRTLGEQLLGLRVVSNRGEHLPPRRAFAWAIVSLLIGIPGLLLVLFSRRNNALQDVICHTAVIYDWRPNALAVVAADGRDAKTGQ